MQTIDDKYLDVDFSTCPEYVRGDLGYNAFDGTRDYESALQSWGSSVLTDSEIDAEMEKIDAAGGGAERLVTRIFNQGREGSCVANACSQAHENRQALQFGKDKVVHLSAMSLYKRIGSGPMSGANVSNGLSEMVKRGILPLDNAENKARFACTHPATGWSNRLPTDWETTAKKFTAVEYYVVRTVGGLLTALCNQHPVVVGREGHSICYLRAMRRNGRRVVCYANSWGQWGSGMGDFQYGFGFDSESQIRKSASWAFALRSVVVPII